MKRLSVLLLGLALTLGLALAQDTGGTSGGASTGGVSGGAMSSETGGSSTGGSETGGGTSLSEESGSVADIVASDPQFSTLLQAVSAAGLAEELSSGGPYTVFAPTNDAFSALPSTDLDAVLSDVEQLTDLLQNHIVSGAYPSTDISGFSNVLMLSGQELPVSVSGSTVMVGDATVTSADIQATNGVIHVIDTVLLPSSMESQTGGSTGGSSTGGSATGGSTSGSTGGSSTGGTTSSTGGSATGGSDNDSD